MTRAILIVLDSVGCGGAEDARAYGDEGADTLGHIAEACARGLGDRAGLRRGPLKLPRLAALGLGHAMRASTGRAPPGFALAQPRGQWGYGVETSRGKDTPSGHWELAGTPVDFDWGYFPETIPAFPEALTSALIAEGRLSGILANRHASGTAIIEEFGEEHLRTGKPICYTSANLVLQIAAHEEAFGLERLYELCRIARRFCDPLNIGRVIARPFVGRSAKDFVRTAHRKDFAVSPPDGNLLQRAARAGRTVVSIGKIGDIFAHRDTGSERKGKSNDGNVDLLLEALRRPRTAGSSSSIWSTSTRSGAIGATSPDTRPASRRSISGWLRSKQRCGLMTIASSPPTTGTIRPSAASTTRASMCRSSPSAQAQPQARSARGRASPTSPRRSRSNLACRRGHMGELGRHEV